MVVAVVNDIVVAVTDVCVVIVVVASLQLPHTLHTCAAVCPASSASVAQNSWFLAVGM
jgi:hypothetical protein